LTESYDGAGVFGMWVCLYGRSLAVARLGGAREERIGTQCFLSWSVIARYG